MALGKNIERIRTAKGLSQDELSDLTGGKVSQGAISALESRDSSKSKFVEDLAKALGVSTNALLFDDRVGGAIAWAEDDDTIADAVKVAEYAVTFSAGNGRTALYEEIHESEPAIYRLSWLHQERLSPANLKRFKVSGDSMEPLLYDRDTILVNLAETSIVDGKVYAIRYVDELRVKRLVKRIDGSLILRSDNPDYPDEIVPADLVNEHITIIGKVRDKSGAGGL